MTSKNQDRDLILAMMLTVGILPIRVFWNAWIFVKLWSWFLIPTGLPVLHFKAAMGIAIIQLFWFQSEDDDVKTKRTSLLGIFWDHTQASFTKPAIALSLGFLLKIII
jgi:hypothetical protein